MSPGPLDRPERAHPAHDDSERPIPGIPSGKRLPPPPAMPRKTDEDIAREQGPRRQSLPEPDVTFPHQPWWKHWTPDLVVKALSLLLVSLVTTLTGIVTVIGGPEAFREVITGGKATVAAIEASKTSILEKLEEQRKADQKAHDELAKRINVVNEKADFLAGFAAALNEGRPHSSVPTDAFGAKPKPAGKGKSAPWVVTDTPYPRLPQN